MSWTDERVELLQKLWNQGLSASQIAAELGHIHVGGFIQIEVEDDERKIRVSRGNVASSAPVYAAAPAPVAAAPAPAEVTEAEVEALFDEVTGLRLKPVFELAVRGTKDLPLADALAAFAIIQSDRRKNDRPSLGARTKKEGGDCKLASVYEGGAAHRAGLSAGDALLAIDGLRVTASSLDVLLQRVQLRIRVAVVEQAEELLLAELVPEARDIQRDAPVEPL